MVEEIKKEEKDMFILLENNVKDFSSEQYFEYLKKPIAGDIVYAICKRKYEDIFFISKFKLISVINYENEVTYCLEHFSKEESKGGFYLDMASYPIYKKNGFTHWGALLYRDETQYVFKTLIEANNFYKLLLKENKIK